MGYSDDALELRNPRTIDLPRSGDRISFVHLDHCKIWQDDTGVLAKNEDGQTIRLPSAGLSVLTLGNGVSISTPALATLHRSGCNVIVTTAGGVASVTTARPLATRAKWAEAQARMWANRNHRLTAARTLYADRFPDINWAAKGSLNAMRGVEGQRVKATYQHHAAEHDFKNWKRETRPHLQDDPVNPLLNLGNSILYAAALTAVAAVSLNPALGIIHRGHTSALLFDLADHHKTQATIPLAFACAEHPRPERELRTLLRDYLHKNRILDLNLKLLDAVLGPHFEETDDVIIGDQFDVAGHTNYSIT